MKFRFLLFSLIVSISSASHAVLLYDTTTIGNQGGFGWTAGASQRFVTDSSGLALTKVSIGIFNNNFPASIDPTVQILASIPGAPHDSPDYGSVIATLTSVSGSTINMGAFNTTQFFDFVANSAVTLASNTAYWVRAFGTNQVGTTSLSFNLVNTPGSGAWYDATAINHVYAGGADPDSQLLNGGFPLPSQTAKILMSIEGDVPVSEPATLGLFMGMFGLLWMRRRTSRA